jgi:hypothetical protein
MSASVDILSSFRLLSSSFFAARIVTALSFASKAKPVADDGGFHTTHFGGIPYGFVYLDIAETPRRVPLV